MKSGLKIRADKSANVLEALREMAQRDVLVGIPSERAERGEGEAINNAELGYIQSYGGTIQMPERSTTIHRKIRPDGTFANNGQFVKAKKSNFTTIHAVKAHTVTIPPRPFLDMGIEEAKKEIVGHLKNAAQAALSGQMSSAEASLGRAGTVAANSAKGIIQAGDKLSPLADSTIRNRHSRGKVGEKPLYVTGELLRAITYIVRDKNASS
ncbi:conserved hypothetical protein [Enterobacterales bacterium 8AC]|nr:conserved hypothetical protein [Enterobacterales bacterium 8AC]